jgi:TolA-binding protein
MFEIIYLFLGIALGQGPGNVALAATGPPAESAVFAAVSPPQGRNAIGGHVFDSSRRPVAHLRVELLDEVDSTIATSLTDSSGRYIFNGLSQGTFQVRVLTHGTNFVGQTARVTITNFSRSSPSGNARISGAQVEQVDFNLKTRDEVNSSLKPTTTAVTFYQDVPDDARAAYRMAVESLDKKKDVERGMAELKRAVELFPTYYLALERLGGEYVKLQQYEQAARMLNRAIEVNPKGHPSLFALGVARYYLKQIPEAIELLRSSISLAPDSPNAAFSHMFLGMALLKDGKPVEAEAHFKQAHQIGDKQVPDVHMHLAQMYSNSKRYKEAADELELFLKETPDARDAESIKNIIKQLRAKAR